MSEFPFFHSGQMVSQTSFAGVETAWTYNNLSEILTETVGTGSLAQTTTNTWDALGRKTAVQDANGTTQMAFDLAGRMTSLTGVDPGTGWHQQAVIVLRECELPHSFPELPLALFDGIAIIGGRRCDGVVPAPLCYTGPVSIEFSFENGTHQRLSATEIHIDLIGDPTYLEEFPGTGKTDE